MKLTDEAVIIYDALGTVFDVLVTGGSLTQKKNTLTGEFVVDRTACPIALCPSLQVTDPNTDNTATDQTAMMVVNWYRVTSSGGSETETEILSTNNNDSYYKSGKNLIVQANVEPGSSVVLRCKASYVNTHTNETMPFKKDLVLSSTSYVEFNPALEVNIPNYSIVSPFKLKDAGNASDNYLRTVTATFFAGTLDISNNNRMSYTWEKKDGNNYRAISSSDVEVVSASGRTMVLDLRCIGRAKYRVTAYHRDFSASQNRKTCMFTIDRQMSGYNMECRVTRGKYLRQNTRESEAEAVLTVNSSVVEDPTEFFVIGWKFYLQSGTSKQNTTSLGFGATAKADRSISGYDKTKVPTFEMEYMPLTEYRLITDDDGVVITDDDDNVIIGQEIDETT